MVIKQSREVSSIEALGVELNTWYKYIVPIEGCFYFKIELNYDLVFDINPKLYYKILTVGPNGKQTSYLTKHILKCILSQNINNIELAKNSSLLETLYGSSNKKIAP